MGANRVRLGKGNFNFMNQELQPDGSLVITLTKLHDPKRYKLCVRKLYQPDEELLWEKTEGHND